MFTKKLEDQFSADLLNTVRGVLDEAKKCPENCECEKCEAEDDDEMKEGFANAAQRKAVWASKADGGAGHPDKKKKMKKEGYMPAADEPSAKDKKTAQKIRDMMAKEKKPVKEDSEQIDELSKPTMGRYINKAKDSIDTASYRQGHREALGGSSKPLEKKLTKRHKGIETAVKKLTKEESEQIDELSKATMGRYVNKAADRMSTQGVTAGLKIAADEKSKKNFDNIAKRQKGIATAVKKLTKEEQDFIDSLNDADMEQIDELSDTTLKSYAKKAMDQATSAHGYQKDAEKSGDHDRARREMKHKWKRQAGARNAIDRLGGNNTLAKEEAEQIDEISKGAALKYLAANKKDDTKARETGDYDRMTKRMRGTDMAVRKYTAKPGSKSVRVPATEEVELEEGRGRPPKEGSAAWKARQGKADDDMVALGMQLRKAHSINKKVRFMDGKEHDIHPTHITRFNDHMGARRTTQEKDNFQRQAHKSHADFVKAVSAPVPKAAKDTGEIVKYR
jgi:hypothetical protein